MTQEKPFIADLLVHDPAADTTISPRFWKRAAIVCAALFLLWSMAFIYRSSAVGIDGNRYFCLFDDAMISMRYAWNFAHGEGLVWNSGERVEGYTNFLMTLLMALGALVFGKSGTALFIQLAGVLFVVVNARVVMRISGYIPLGRSEHWRAMFRWLTFILALAYYPLLYWSIMGMETGLLTMLLSLGVLAAFRYVKDGDGRQGILLAIYLGLAYLTRPDAAIFALLIGAYLIYGPYGTGWSPKRSELMTLAGIYLIFVVGLGVFRFWYYGELWPNTYTLKVSGMPLMERLRNGAGFMSFFLDAVKGMMAVAGLALLFNFFREKLFLFSIMAALICYQIWSGGDPWPYWRIVSPAMPLLLVLFLHEIITLVDLCSGTNAFRRYFLRRPVLPAHHIPVALVLVATGAALVFANFYFLKQAFLLEPPYQTEENIRNVNTALALGEISRPNASVGVFWAGVIPYYTSLYAIDFLGKSDPHIARLAPDLSGAVAWSRMNSVPGHNKYDLHYSIKQKRPTYVSGFEWGRDDLKEWGAANYVSVTYKGVPLWLRKGSSAIRWELLDAAPRE